MDGEHGKSGSAGMVESNGTEHDQNGERPAISEEEALAAFLGTREMLRQLFAEDSRHAEEEFDRQFPISV